MIIVISDDKGMREISLSLSLADGRFIDFVELVL